MRNARRGAHNAAHEISLSTSSFLPASIASYTYFLLAGLSYGARKHTGADTGAITAGSGKSYRAFILRAPHTRCPGPRISSEIASTSITNSHLARPDAVPPSGGFSARCPPGCYFGSPESDFHFDGFLRISIGTSRTRRKFAHCGPRKSRRRVSRAERFEMHQCDLLCR